MSKVKMFATRSMTYGTRRLQVGDDFVCSEAHARVLAAIGKARPESGRPQGDVPPMPEALRHRALRAADPAPLSAPPAGLAARATETAALRHPLDHDGDGRPGGSTAPADEIAALRAEYTQVAGKRFFSRWNAEQLREKIAAARAAG